MAAANNKVRNDLKLAVIGATGNVGVKIVNEALDRNHTVTGIARDVGKLAPRTGLTAVAVDLTDGAKLADAIRGHDAVIVSVRHDRSDVRDVFAAARTAGVKRLLVVGGAASLFNKDGVRLLDTPGFPDFIKVEAAPAAAAHDWMRTIDDLDWTFLSPSMFLQPGERTGKFRIGADELLVDDKGESKISQEDLAVALIDEAETPKHVRTRFTVGY